MTRSIRSRMCVRSCPASSGDCRKTPAQRRWWSAADDLEKKLVAVREDLINLAISANEDSLAYPPQLDAKLAYLAMDVGSADSAPTEAEQKQFEKLKRQSGELVERWEDLQRRDLAAFQKLTAEGSLSTVVVPPAGRATEEPVAAH